MKSEAKILRDGTTNRWPVSDSNEAPSSKFVLIGIAEEARRTLDVTTVALRIDGIGTIETRKPGRIPERKRHHLPVGQRLHNLVLARGTPVRIDHIPTDITLPRADRIRLSNQDYQSLLAVPIAIFDRQFGTFVCLSKQRNRFKRRTKLASLFAAYSAMVLENHRLFAELREKRAELTKIDEKLPRTSAHPGTLLEPYFHDLRTQLQVLFGYVELFVGLGPHELTNPNLDTIKTQAQVILRQLRELPNVYYGLHKSALQEQHARLTRELHDGPSQHLGILWLTLARLQKLANLNQARPDIDMLQKVAGNAYDELSELMTNKDDEVSGEHPSALDSFEDWLAEWAQHAGIKVESKIDPQCERRLCLRSMVELLKIGREALSNVAKHSRAHVCKVTLEDSGKFVRLTIKDDGKGFDVKQTSRLADLCHGLEGMRQRAKLLGGTLSLRSRRNVGTTVLAKLPKSKDL